MSEHPNATRAREIFDGFNASEFSQFQQIVTDDVVFHAGGTGSFSGTYHGSDAFFSTLAGFHEFSGGTQHLDVEAVLASDKYLVAFLRGSARRETATQNVRFVIAVKLSTDGRWREFWYLPDDQRAVDQFWTR